MTHLSFETAYALLHNIHEYTANDYDALGVTQQDMKIITGDKVWRREQMHPIMRTFDCIMNGTLEILAMPKTNVPAEFQAAVICGVVANPNIRLACAWLSMERKMGASVIDTAAGSNAGSSTDPATEGQLFALCCILKNSDRADSARTRMLDKLGIAQIKAMEEAQGAKTDRIKTPR